MTSSKRLNTQKGRKTKSAEPTTTKKLVSVSISSAMISLSATFLFIFIASIILINTYDPYSAIAPAAYVSLYLCALLCGLIAKKISHFPSLLIGLTSGFALTLIIMTASFFLPPSADLVLTPGSRALIFLSLFPTCIIGTFIGGFKVVKKHRSPYSKRR